MVPNLVFIVQYRRADLLYAALGADNADQIRTAELQLVVLADFVEVFEMFAGHASILAECPRIGKAI